MTGALNLRQLLRRIVGLRLHHEVDRVREVVKPLRRGGKRCVVFGMAAETALEDRARFQVFRAARVTLQPKKNTPFTRSGAIIASVRATTAPSLQPTKLARSKPKESMTACTSDAISA